MLVLRFASLSIFLSLYDVSAETFDKNVRKKLLAVYLNLRPFLGPSTSKSLHYRFQSRSYWIVEIKSRAVGFGQSAARLTYLSLLKVLCSVYGQTNVLPLQNSTVVMVSDIDGVTIVFQLNFWTLYHL